MIIRRDNASLQLISANLRAGKIVAMMSDTIYGFVGRAPDTDMQIRQIKARKPTKPFLQLIPNVDALENLGIILPGSNILNLWPGPFTIILKTSIGETASFRVPKDEYTQMLISELGFNLYSTSVNRNDEAPINDPIEIERRFGSVISLVEDSGTPPTRRPSTVVDATVWPHRIVRHGAGIVPKKYLEY